jgi:hypothetical protein
MPGALRTLLLLAVVDSEGRRCGNVDHLAIEGGPGETPRVVAILVGPGYWGQRAGWSAVSPVGSA